MCGLKVAVVSMVVVGCVDDNWRLLVAVRRGGGIFR